jgi:hypothetical protein
MTTLALHRDAQGERWDAWLTLGWCLGRRQLDTRLVSWAASA